jgi:hypothetical protein
LVEDATMGRPKARQDLLMLFREFPQAITPDIRPSGVIMFRMQTLKDVSLDEFLEVHPETPHEHLAVLRKYFGPDPGPGVDFNPSGSGDGKNRVLPNLVPPRGR